MEKRRQLGQTLLFWLRSANNEDDTPKDRAEIKDILSQGCDWSKAADNDGHTVLHLVAIHWDDVIMKLLFGHGVRAFRNIINQKDNHSYTAFHLACKEKNTGVRDFLLKNKEEIGLDLHTCDNDGASPLATIVRHIDVEGTKKLLEAGACVLFPDDSNYSNPLYSARYHYNHSRMNNFTNDLEKANEIFALLLQEGPPRDLCRKLKINAVIPEEKKFTFMFANEEAEDVHCMLFDKGWIKPTLDETLSVWHKNPFVETAMKMDMVRLMETLYREGVDMVCKKSTGGHILHDATLRGATKVLLFLCDTVKLDPNTVHPLFVETPLHVAAKFNFPKVALVLGKRSANFYKVDKKGKVR